MKNILVTGGAGYIGSHTCLGLAEAGFTPVVYDNLVYGHREAVQWGPFEQGEIGDVENVSRVIKQYDIQAVLHFAAYAYVGESVTDPEKYYENNIHGSLGLLKAVRQSGIRDFIFSSTCAVYGIPKVVPITETAPLDPVNPYGYTKMVIERAIQDYARAYSLSSIRLRYFNACGADPGGRIGECHNPETHLIPLAIDAVKNKPLTVFGSDFPTPDGTCVRDYIHVNDLADAHVKALQQMTNLKDGETRVYNLGVGKGYSVKEVCDTIGRVAGEPVRFTMGPRRAGDPPSLYADPKLANTELGWRPKHDLESIIKTALAWSRR